MVLELSPTLASVGTAAVVSQGKGGEEGSGHACEHRGEGEENP